MCFLCLSSWQSFSISCNLCIFLVYFFKDNLLSSVFSVLPTPLEILLIKFYIFNLLFSFPILWCSLSASSFNYSIEYICTYIFFIYIHIYILICYLVLFLIESFVWMHYILFSLWDYFLITCWNFIPLHHFLCFLLISFCLFFCFFVLVSVLMLHLFSTCLVSPSSLFLFKKRALKIRTEP